ncbi:MAG: hypothetical protein WBQ72_11420 [Terriglobales bacterium]|jgi:hypothetical protein
MTRPETRGEALPKQESQEPEQPNWLPEEIGPFKDEWSDPFGIFFQPPDDEDLIEWVR